jgi:hypothetical protein
MFKKSSSAPTTFGRRRLRSSAALQAWQMSRTTAFEARLYSQAAAPQAELQAMEPRFTISLASAPNRPKTLELQWSEAIQLFLDLESALLMSSRGCSGPH